MKLSRKKAFIIILAILITVNLAFVLKERQEYNKAVENVAESYDYLYKDMTKLLQNESIDFFSVEHQYVLFMGNYMRWDPMFTDLAEHGKLPEETNTLRGDSNEACWQLRNLYYEAVETVYFNHESPTEKMMETLEENKASFDALFGKF